MTTSCYCLACVELYGRCSRDGLTREERRHDPLAALVAADDTPGRYGGLVWNNSKCAPYAPNWWSPATVHTEESI